MYVVDNHCQTTLTPVWEQQKIFGIVTPELAGAGVTMPKSGRFS